jgi:hypothetical protein
MAMVSATRRDGPTWLGRVGNSVIAAWENHHLIAKAPELGISVIVDTRLRVTGRAVPFRKPRGQPTSVPE